MSLPKYGVGGRIKIMRGPNLPPKSLSLWRAMMWAGNKENVHIVFPAPLHSWPSQFKSVLMYELYKKRKVLTNRTIWLTKNSGWNNNSPHLSLVYKCHVADTGPNAFHIFFCSQEVCERGERCYSVCFKYITTFNVHSHAVRSLLLVPISRVK